MKLNPDILEAIRQAVDYYGNTSQFAKKIGVAHSTVLFWLSGKTSNISGTIWDNKVRRELRKFMPDSPPAIPRKNLSIREARQPYYSAMAAEPDDEKAGKPEFIKVPAIHFSQMNELDITMQSPVSFAKKRCLEEVRFAADCNDYSFALILDNPAFCPCLPTGSRILISGCDYADDGDIVIGKTRNPAKLFFCRYSRRGEKICLSPLNPDFPAMEWENKENAENVFWIFPVKEISINLEGTRWTDRNSLIRKPIGE